MTQKEIVLNIVLEAGMNGIRTEQVKILAMQKGVSCADRFLRWLVKENEIRSYKVEKDCTKTWVYNFKVDSNGQFRFI